MEALWSSIHLNFSYKALACSWTLFSSVYWMILTISSQIPFSCFLILLLQLDTQRTLIVNLMTYRATTIHSGERTHHQDQLIWPCNLSTTNAMDKIMLVHTNNFFPKLGPLGLFIALCF